MLAALFVRLLVLPASAQEPAAAPRDVEGRVRDAYTGSPVPEVQVELFTEERFGEAELVAETRTGEDGTYRLTDRAGRGEKLRLRHPRYRSTLSTRSTDEFVLFPRGEPCELLVVDLDGRPIEGAEVLFRQTCRHAVPTTAARSAASGRILWPDLPPLGDEGEISVLADGYGALGDLEPSDFGASTTLYLPRRREVELRLLDERGLPVGANSCWYEGSHGGYPVATDADGRAVLRRLFDDASGAVELRSSMMLGLPPAGAPYTLRFSDEEPAGARAHLQVLLDVPPEEQGKIPLRAFHDEGFVCEELGQGTELIPGRWRVVLGRAFSGYRETVLPLELAPGERRVLAPALEREPVLHVLLPAGGWTVHVQVGEDSISRYADGGETFSTGVPPGGDVIVLAQGREVRRAQHAAWSGQLTLDLRETASLLQAAAPADASFELAFRVRSAADEPLDVEASLLTRGEPPPDEDPTPDGVRFQLVPGARYEVCLSAEHHLPLYRAGIAPAAGSRFEEIVLPLE